jgi:hypothetical protein
VASVRDVILQALVARLATIAGFTAQLRGVGNSSADLPLAVVLPISEDKSLANSEAYDCTLNVGVLLTVGIEDADATIDAGNAFRYLDRQVVLIEKKIHDPDSWGPNPPFTDVLVNGHDVSEIEGDDTKVDAFVRLTFRYRHHYQNPEAA